MTTVTSLNLTVNDPRPAKGAELLDPEWIVAIQEEIAAQPETLSDVVEPELMGRFDAEMGFAPRPLEFYAKLGDIEAYLIGHKDTAAKLEEAREYEDDRLDREYHGRGSW